MSLRKLFSRRTSSSSSQTYDLPRRASSFSEVSQTPHGAEALAALDRGKFAGAWEPVSYTHLTLPTILLV